MKVMPMQKLEIINLLISNNVQEVRYILLASFVMPLLLSALLIWFVISYQKRKNKHEMDEKDHLLKQQQLIIEKQQGIERERNRIASEMHDDLGSGLTTIKYLSERVNKLTSDGDSKALISKIENHAQELVTNMSEIIWTMNTRYDDVDNLAGFMRRYAHNFFENYDIVLQFIIEDSCADQPIQGEIRRDLFLIFKEILHNSVKHSGANKIVVIMECVDELVIKVEEVNGKGFDPNEKLKNGNGIYNMQKRIENIGGRITYSYLENSMFYSLSYKLPDTEAEIL